MSGSKFCVLFSVLILCAACRHDLTRDEAQRLIAAKFKPREITAEVPNTMSWSCAKTNEDLRRATAGRFKQLIDAGLMDSTLTGVRRPAQYTCGDNFQYEYKFDFTDRGRAALVGRSPSSDKYAVVRLCREELGEVTGVTPADGNGVSQVEYTTVHAERTPFADAMPSECGGEMIVKHATTARRFDDGWRLE